MGVNKILYQKSFTVGSAVAHARRPAHTHTHSHTHSLTVSWLCPSP